MVKFMIYEPGYRLNFSLTGKSLWLLFNGDRLLVAESDNRADPFFSSEKLGNCIPDLVQNLGKIDGVELFTGEIPKDEISGENIRWTTVHGIFNKVDAQIFWIAARAYHLHNWNKNSSFCGRCGKPTVWMEEDRAKRCPDCGYSVYPRISPAVITAIIREGKILLARSPRFTVEMYSVIAGFVEPGENLEECVRREVREEVGLEVKNIRYFGSQPWPFPDSLMVGFLADYESGEIKIDEKEIITADWFSYDKLPNIPPGNLSIARRLIDWYSGEYGKK